MKKILLSLTAIGLCGLVFFTGCWDKMEINDRSYVITIGIDKYTPESEGMADTVDTKSKNKYTLSLGFAKIEKTGGANTGEKTAEESEAALLSAPSLSSAMKLPDLLNSRQAYYGQTKAVLFGSDILSDEKLMKEALDTLERDQEINSKTVVLASANTAAEGVDAVSQNEEPSGLFLWDYYKNNAKETLAAAKTNLEDLLIKLRQNKSALIPLITVETGSIKMGGAAVMKDYKLAGYVEDNLERGALFISEDGAGNVIDCDFYENTVPVRILKNKTSFSFEEKDGLVYCHVDISCKGNIEGYTIDGASLFNDDNIHEIETITEEIIENEALQTLTLFQKDMKADPLGILPELKKRNYPLYQKYETQLDNLYQNVVFAVDCDTNISGIGMIQ